MPQTTQNKVGILLRNSTSPFYDSFYPNGDRGGVDPELAFSTYSTLAAYDNVGGAWSEQSDGTGNFMRCNYVGQNTGPYQLRKDVTGQPSEYWIAFDQRQSLLTGSSKLMKWFGYNNGNGWTSNNTWNNGYNASYREDRKSVV